MEKKRRIKKTESNFLFSLGLKYCSKCKTIKKLDKFCKHKGEKNGFHPYCRECNSKYSKAYYRNPIIKQRRKAYFKKRGQIPEVKARHVEAVKRNVRTKRGKRQLYIRDQTQYYWGSASQCPCANCRGPAIQWHHFSYNDDWRHQTIPVCLKCHTNIHHGAYE